MSGDLIYEVLRIFGYVNLQKEINRVCAGFATPDEKHALIYKLRSRCCAPDRNLFTNQLEYDAAKAKYDALKEQLYEIGRTYDNDSETSELAKLAKEIKSEIVPKPADDVKPVTIANPKPFKGEDYSGPDGRTENRA